MANISHNEKTGVTYLSEDADQDMSGPGETIPDLVAPLSSNARTVLEKRYLRRGNDGQPIESVEEMFWRISYNVALAEEKMGGTPDSVARQFFDLLTTLRFLPNSPTFTGAGTPLGQLAACFVLPISDDMGRDSAGIFQTLRDAALIQQTGGGNGFCFSDLRHKGSMVNTSAGRATGPVGFLRVYDRSFGEIAQGGTRRGANMAVLRVDHPDIREFITCKTNENQITNFNISVAVTDAFMEAVEVDGTYELIAPHTGEVVETVRACEIFDLIIEYAHHNGEPGMLFIDAANRQNPLPHIYDLESTNPCGEQFLGPYENCCLGSINLAQHFGADKTVDWEKLEESVQLSTRFLDDVVTANAYVPAVPQLQDAALRARRIGLGIMGLGDLMYHVNVRYGSPEAQEFAAQLMEFVRYHCMQTSIELAKERGPFPAITGSIYDPDDLKWIPPKPISPHSCNFQRPPVDWDATAAGIRTYGIRNAAQTTVAPTGTIATVAGCEAYGCEPTFALAYVRHVDDGGKDLELNYASPLFENALIDAGLEDESRRKIIEHIRDAGSCQNVADVPEDIRNTFVVSQDITAEEHVRMQSALQVFVDNSISKTCNFPADAKEADVAEAYRLAWGLGCKGLTVYVTGTRKKVVLSTRETAQGVASDQTPLMFPESKKPRPKQLKGETHLVDTPLGHSYVTINEDGIGEPLEVFITTAKAGSETSAVSEAIGRLISCVLRLASPVVPRERLAEVVRQLDGIGGGRSLGFGPNRVRSLPDGVARALLDYLTNHPGTDESIFPRIEDGQLALRIGDLCPDCGEAAIVNEEGCRKCYACGYSEC